MPEVVHPFIELAATAIEIYLSEDRVIEPPPSLYELFPDAGLPAAVFVCLKRGGQLRGCVGTTEPARPTRAGEVIANAIGAATRDPRFPSVMLEEVSQLAICVDVLSPYEPVTDRAELDPKRYGILLVAGERRSVLLPDIEGVSTLEEQLTTARKKAGIDPDEAADLFRFEVTRYQ
jgi:AmmeMemoRadiSam system protein A